ncbi:MAG TPA: hypothetical protein VFW33_17500 [Gemmataceae bacterium]|nr:hypothetical protein [Gemmataceae bacterium]
MAPRKFSDLAAKAARDPYVLELPDGTSVSIAQPTVAMWNEVPFSGGMGAVLLALGVSEDDMERVTAAMQGAPLGVADDLVVDIRGHFGLGN